MRKVLLVLLAAVGSAYLGYRLGDAMAVCFKVTVQPVEHTTDKPDSGAIGGGGSCELPWIICWKSA